VDIKLDAFLILAIDGGNWSTLTLQSLYYSVHLDPEADTFLNGYFCVAATLNYVDVSN
jgi:hypothetical protein